MFRLFVLRPSPRLRGGKERNVEKPRLSIDSGVRASGCFPCNPDAATSFPREAVDADRVLSRLGMYYELQPSFEGLNRNETRQFLADLLPPNLRQPLQQRLAAHGRLICRNTEPSCGACEFRNFC